MSIKVQNGIPIVPQPLPLASEQSAITLDSVSISTAEGESETTVAVTDIAFSASLNSDSIEVPLFPQKRTLWCWAACAKMVLHSLGRPNIPQCRIAKSLLGKNCCAATCGKSCCNNDCTEDDVATVYQSFGVNADFHDGTISFSRLQEEISDNELLVEVAIDWPGDNGGHLLLVNGWSRHNDVRWVNIKDPFYGEGEIRFSDLVRYEGGRWIFTWTGLI